MSSKYLLYADSKKRELMFRKEPHSMLLHCIYNEHLLYSDPCAIDSLHEESFHFAHYTGMKRAVHSMYRSKIRNRCFHSGQARGVYCRYRLARFALKMLARNGDLNGISKSSW